MHKIILTLCLLMPINLFAHGMSEADRQRILEAGFFDFAELGAVHMLSGYDHLLFLLGVVFFLSRFIDVLKFVTAFTVGHSITLIFATIYQIQANYYLIDAVIALTVCYKAFENLDGFRRYIKIPAPNLTGMVFVFGLVHGFGLSTRLQQLPLAEQGLVGNILGFNLGVEVGQVLALSVMLLLLHAWRQRTSFMHFSRLANIALMICGGFLLLMQLHAYQHTAFNESFPINRDDHQHAHEEMRPLEKPSALDGYKKRINLPAP